ncbi:GNAT family N-acetyltransferase [Nocardia wallacei]|uniref:GNAT family N-acetyltransferase n=1 Tax=Nocardia wallacei TaxID=480035 RepID=UPI002458DA70|nr:GNAT family N-acetyltransferase [Nocardia wallacei]
MASVEMRDLGSAELGEAAGVLGRGMRENPIVVRVFGAEPASRERSLTRFFRFGLRGLVRQGTVAAAFRDGRLVGVCGMGRPRERGPGPVENLAALSAIALSHPPGTALRIVRWTGAWARRDPDEPHWHLGPVAVDAGLQGQGIGSVMLEQFCARMESERAVGYLETDKPENVSFYTRFGFTVVGEADILGVPNWFMRRGPGLPDRR